MAVIPREALEKFRTWALQPQGLACLVGIAFIAGAVIADYAFEPSGILVILSVLLGVSGIVAAIVGIKPAFGWLRQIGTVAGTALFAVYGVLVFVAIPIAIINWTSEHLPRSLHIAILTLVSMLLAWGFYSVSTEKLRARFLTGNLVDLDEHPVLIATIYSALLLITTGRVLASFTFILFDNGAVDLSSNIAGEVVVERRLLDFYLWHFLEVVPFLQIPEVTNLREPITYSGSLVGMLVLLFQGLWVLILIPTFRSVARNRREPEYADVMALYKRAVNRVGIIVDRVQADELNQPTPCDGWDTRALLNHIVYGNHLWAESSVLDEQLVLPGRMPDFLGVDFVKAYDKSAEAAVQGLSKGLLEREYRTPQGEKVMGLFAPGLALIEIAVHGWDLAKATGQNATIEDDIAIGAYNLARSNDRDKLPRHPDSGYKNPVQVPFNASPTDKLVAFLGRDPSWKAPPRAESQSRGTKSDSRLY